MGRVSRVVGLGAVVVAALLGPAVSAQHSQTSTVSKPIVKAAAEEVLLDVVVRDKKGHTVNSLKPEDFQISDNGEPRRITNFRLIEGSEAIAADGARMPLDAMGKVRLEP